MTSITIRSNKHEFSADLYDTPTAAAIAKILPIQGTINRWGGEIYFTIPAHLPLEPDSRATLTPGELGYWPTGLAFCIFFGPTPASKNSEPKAASPVNIFGKINGPLENLWQIKEGSPIEIELIDYL